jgi:predicted Rossmann-fold nucleotide-binding protein
MRQNYTEVTGLYDLRQILSHNETIRHCAFQAINFEKCGFPLENYQFEDCLFMGCILPGMLFEHMDEACIVFPRVKMPFKVFPNKLYTAETLYLHYKPGYHETYYTCYDTIVYDRYVAQGKESSDIKETLCRVLHDHSIASALDQFVENYDEKDIVALMGGHAVKRTDASYHQIVDISKRLTEAGKLMISGGGPGAMEAVHLGAWMAGRSEAEVEDALSILAPTPTFREKGWLTTAWQVMDKYPRDPQFHSLGIPTWYYGHEPATPFASQIAKLFDNSVRENLIISLPKGGIIYTPGSAGTFQEIFQDAAQNHYKTLGYASPMIFLGKDYYMEENPIYTLLAEMQDRGKYQNLLLSITDDTDDVIRYLMDFHRPYHQWSAQSFEY